jgi:peptide/nickel transport system ATP-binding protein
MNAPLVDVRNLGRTFEVSKPWLNRVVERRPRQYLQAVANASFSIGRRQTFALVGESGSGKSTVAKMTVGLIPPSEGEVSIDGISMYDPRDAARRRKLRRKLQMVFQDPYASLNPRWRAFDIIAEPIRAFKLARSMADVARRVGELLTLVGLDPAHGSHYPHEFSGGMRQRIAVARALASNPEFVVCDEPTSALDVSVQAQILNLMRDLQERFGLTYLFISHNLAVVRHMADRIGVMYLGRLVEIAATKEIFAAPRHPYTRMLLAAVPDLKAAGDVRKAVQGEPPNPLNPPTGCAFHTRCPHANARCRAELPPLSEIDGTKIACHAVAEGRI